MSELLFFCLVMSLVLANELYPFFGSRRPRTPTPRPRRNFTDELVAILSAPTRNFLVAYVVSLFAIFRRLLTAFKLAGQIPLQQVRQIWFTIQFGRGILTN